MFIALINGLFAIWFWNLSTEAAEDGRTGWAWAYLFTSAVNGASAMVEVF